MNAASLSDGLLPPGVRSRFVANVNGLRMHILEAGYQTDNRPVVLLLHGFPELAWSWRKVMPALAAAGFHVVAPDQRGYGRTTGWDAAYDGDLASFRPLNLVQDLLDLVFAMGRRHVRAVVGHDFGSLIAAHCALIRPDVFTSLVMMSAPFAGPPPIGAAPTRPADIRAALASLTPARKHYQWYYSTRQADGDMLGASQGLHDFLRAYYHDVYCAEFARTGFQGALQWYRCATSGLAAADLRLFTGRTISVPATFIAGAADWGTYQSPGLLEGLDQACTDLRGRHLVAAAGHWVQQEQAPAVTDLLRAFLTD